MLYILQIIYFIAILPQQVPFYLHIYLSFQRPKNQNVLWEDDLQKCRSPSYPCFVFCPKMQLFANCRTKLQGGFASLYEMKTIM